jgi:predicted RNase H-like nuclease (RuvC/YqgF family)
MGQPAHLAAWQAERRERKREDVRQAIRRLDARGVAITFAVVADEARVDRSWLYTQEDLAAEIRRLREETSGPLRPRPQHERASDASLRVRLAAAQQTVVEVRRENEQLRAEIRALRREISQLRGKLWEPPRE